MSEDFSKNPEPRRVTWDYVVVGAGAAGCVLANRLTASGRHRVLLLEAGGSDSSVWIRIPAGFTRTLFDPTIGWGYANAPAEPTRHRSIPCPRGRVLGGSSSINGHLYVRGQAADYDTWAASGCPGWSWDEVLPWFKIAETRMEGDPTFRGTDGPLHVTDPTMRHPLCEAFVESMTRLGHARNADYNSGDQSGTGYYQYLIRDGRRWSAADAYLRPALRRPNLTVRSRAHVTRVVVRDGRATGVECRIDDRGIQSFHAAREVILAAGAINTPALLQLSGIGDPSLLARHAIPLTVASPQIGENLVDHYAVRVAARVRGAASLNERTHGLSLALEVLKYAATRRGVLASAVAHAFGFVRVMPDGTRPDLQLLFAPASYERGKVGQAGLERAPGLTCGICQMRPDSRGHVRIVSADPFVAPEIQPNYLAAAADRATLHAGVRLVRELFATEGLARHVESETWPGADVSDEVAVDEFIRTTGSTVYHPVGTCRMGSAPTDPVDPALRVRGVPGLRVVDASVMPSMVSGNTYAATIMIAERGASLIARDANDAGGAPGRQAGATGRPTVQA